MAPGSWSLTLSDQVPRYVRDTLDYYGHIVILPTRVDPTAIGDTATLAAARYTGIVRAKPGRTSLAGVGLVAWLGDEDGKGDVLESLVSHVAGSFSTWITGLRPASLAAGTVTDPGGTLTWSAQYTSRRAALDYVSDYFGTEYKIRPDGKLDAGTAAVLFGSTPTAIVTPTTGGRDLNIFGIPATEFDRSEDVEDYTTRVVLVGPAGVGTADIAPATAYKDLLGGTAKLVRLIDGSNVVSGNESTIATAQLGRFTSTRKAVRLSTDRYDIAGDVEAGATIYVYDPDLGLTDTTNQVYYRGQLLFPAELRVLGHTWPIERGMGVFYRSGAGTYTDLTDWVVWESPGASLDVGAAPRALTGGDGPQALSGTQRVASRPSRQVAADTGTDYGGLSATTWTTLSTNFDLVVPANVGDVIEARFSFMWDNAATEKYIDFIAVASGNAWSSSHGAAGQGIMAGKGQNGAYTECMACAFKTVVAGDLSAGAVTVRVTYRLNTATTSIVFNTADYRPRFETINHGPMA